MKKHTTKEILKVILECAKLYQTYLVDKDVLFIYKIKVTNRYEHLEASFKPHNFFHLTGIENPNNISALSFYDRCISNTLKEADIQKDRYTDLKLSVLPELMQIHRNANMLGPSSGSTNCKVYTEKFAGNTRGCLGFKAETDNPNCIIPSTALREDVRTITNPTNQIMAIYYKHYESKLYKNISYTAKQLSKTPPTQITWNKEINAKIDTVNLIDSR